MCRSICGGVLAAIVVASIAALASGRVRPAITSQPAFPGAEGFGATTVGGRGGRVIEVTNLADSGPGSLRDALAQPGARTVVFRVSGSIVNLVPLEIRQPFVTVAGQTAPGDGILLKGEELRVQTHDVVLRHLRIRTGDVVTPQDGWDNRDAINFGAPNDGAWNVVVDHCSLSWSVDELACVWYGSHDITIQWCILSEALYDNKHPKGPHSMGLLIGDGSYNVSVHHNLIAHNNQRNPEVDGVPNVDIRFNLVYNWGEIPAYFDSPGDSVNFADNCYLPGPDAGRNIGPTAVRVNDSASDLDLFIEGNVDPTVGLTDDNWSMVLMTSNNLPPPDDSMRIDQPLADPPPITSKPLFDACFDVLCDAGATEPKRDFIDRRVIHDLLCGLGRIIDSQADVGGWPKYRSKAPPLDTDVDGMPDSWELGRALDPQDAADGSLDRDGDGYTNLEEYLNELAL